MKPQLLRISVFIVHSKNYTTREDEIKKRGMAKLKSQPKNSGFHFLFAPLNFILIFLNKRQKFVPFLSCIDNEVCIKLREMYVRDHAY